MTMPGPRGRPIKPRHIPSWVPLFNRLARPLLALGVPMGPDVLITVQGRKACPELPRWRSVNMADVAV